MFVPVLPVPVPGVPGAVGIFFRLRLRLRASALSLFAVVAGSFGVPSGFLATTAGLAGLSPGRPVPLPLFLFLFLSLGFVKPFSFSINLSISILPLIFNPLS